MKKFNFKQLSKEDLDLMTLWFQEPTIKHAYARDQHFSLEDIKNKYLPRILGNENIPSFIVHQNNSPIGFIQYYVLTNSLPDGMSNHHRLFKQYNQNEMVGIDCFIANDNSRGRGLGAQIINEFIAELLTHYKLIIVDPMQDNLQAIKCYEKAGFQRSTYSENNDFLIMIKPTNFPFEESISTQNAPHFTWGNACDGWWLKKDGRFTVITEIMPPGTAEKKHYHKLTEQFFYCLQGELIIQLEDKKIHLLAHEGYGVGSGVSHKVKNTTNEMVHFLVISSPNSHDDRVDVE